MNSDESISKEQVLRELHAARNALGENLFRAADELNPRLMVQRSFASHRWVWVAAGGVAGLLLVRGMMPRPKAPKIKIERDNTASSATKGGLIALILAPLIAMGRKAVLNYATQYAKRHLHHYFSRHEGARPRA